MLAFRARRPSEPEAAAESKARQNSAKPHYKPGDAAKRNASKHVSNNYHPDRGTQQKPKRAPIEHGSQTIWEDDEIPAYSKSLDDVHEYLNRRIADNPMPYDPLIHGSDSRNDEPDGLIGSHRHRLNPADRHDWTQRSECGDDERHLLDLPLMRKRDRAHDAHYAAESAGSIAFSGRAEGASQAHVSRQKSQGDLPENLIADAVRKIKDEEKVKRRQSLLGLFRRH